VSGGAVRGRRRDASRDVAFRNATLELLAEVGYDRLTMEAVAARAGAGKTTLYRRWANKAELVVDAVMEPRPELAPIPDTGSVRGDFDALIEIWQNPGQQARLLSALIPILPHSPKLRDAFRGDLRGTRTMRTVIERGIARGEIEPPRDPELLEALYPALSLYRLVLLGEEADADFARRVLDDVVMPLLRGAGC
jgi:AcrR family transcriptional regulator